MFSRFSRLSKIRNCGILSSIASSSPQQHSAFRPVIPQSCSTLQTQYFASRNYIVTPTPPSSASKSSDDKSTSQDTKFVSSENTKQHRTKRSNRRFMGNLLMALVGAATIWAGYRYVFHKGQVVYSEDFTAMRGTNGEILTTRQLFLMLGIFKLPTNCFAARMSNGDLLVYNPVELTAELKKEIVDKLMGKRGATVHLIVANNEHTLFVQSWVEGFGEGSVKKHVSSTTNLPRCIVYVRDSNTKAIQKVQAATKDSKNTFLVVAQSPIHFPEQIRREFDIRFIQGTPMLDEIVLFHKKHHVLVCCDLVQFVTRDTFPRDQKMPWTVRFFFEYVAGSMDKLAAPREMKAAFLSPKSNKEQFEAGVRAICALPIQGIFMAHGNPIAPIGDNTKLGEMLLDQYNERIFGKKR